MVLYKEFKVKELFTVSGTKSSNKGDLVFTEDGINFVGRTNEGNGIQGTVSPMKHEPNEGNTITISQVGTIVAKYQSEPYYTSQNIAKLENSNLDRNTGLYMASVINKALILYEGYNTPKLTDIKDIILQLPVKTLEDTEPDWEYMEEYIKQKELAYVGKLNQEFEQKKEQLIELIGEESEYINIEELPTAKFKVGDFMEMTPGKRVTKNNQVKGDVPYVTALTTNNGIDNYISNPPFVIENVITISFIGDGFYHPYKLSFKDGTYGFKMKEGYMETQSIYLYLLTMIEKQTKKLGSYSNAVRGEQILDFEIELPSNIEAQELEPDWNAMERYVARIELQLLNRITNTLNT